jgi:hypothetical protein
MTNMRNELNTGGNGRKWLAAFDLRNTQIMQKAYFTVGKNIFLPVLPQTYTSAFIAEALRCILSI